MKRKSGPDMDTGLDRIKHGVPDICWAARKRGGSDDN